MRREQSRGSQVSKASREARTTYSNTTRRRTPARARTAAVAAMEITRPMNGAEFIESLRDGREVYIYGERVKDVTTHPAFRNTARMIARLYDALHDPKRKDKLLLPTDTGNGGFTHA